MAENTIILPQVEELPESSTQDNFIVERDGSLHRLNYETFKESLNIGESIDINSFEFITVDDIDTICGNTIINATNSEVTF